MGSRSTSSARVWRQAQESLRRPRGGRGGQESVNVVAAGKHHGSPAIIVDIGTATTVEAVDDEANYLGGAVMTGVYVAIDALVARSAKLRA